MFRHLLFCLWHSFSARVPLDPRFPPHITRLNDALDETEEAVPNWWQDLLRSQEGRKMLSSLLETGWNPEEEPAFQRLGSLNFGKDSRQGSENEESNGQETASSLLEMQVLLMTIVRTLCTF